MRPIVDGGGRCATGGGRCIDGKGRCIDVESVLRRVPELWGRGAAYFCCCDEVAARFRGGAPMATGGGR